MVLVNTTPLSYGGVMAKRNKNKLKKSKHRNPFAFDPIMKKGGVHEKTTKAKRKASKQEMKRELKQLPFSLPIILLFKERLTSIRFNGNVHLSNQIT